MCTIQLSLFIKQSFITISLQFLLSNMFSSQTSSDPCIMLFKISALFSLNLKHSCHIYRHWYVRVMAVLRINHHLNKICSALVLWWSLIHCTDRRGRWELTVISHVWKCVCKCQNISYTTRCILRTSSFVWKPSLDTLLPMETKLESTENTLCFWATKILCTPDPLEKVSFPPFGKT